MELPDFVIYSAANSRLVVYRSDFAGTNKATGATWVVGDELESIVQDLSHRLRSGADRSGW
jgi:hypothetical protein